MTNSDGSPCRNCGRLVHTGEGKIGISLTPDQLYRLARDATDPTVHAMLVCALSLLDPDRAELAHRGIW